MYLVQMSINLPDCRRLQAPWYPNLATTTYQTGGKDLIRLGIHCIGDMIGPTAIMAFGGIIRFAEGIEQFFEIGHYSFGSKCSSELTSATTMRGKQG